MSTLVSAVIDQAHAVASVSTNTNSPEYAAALRGCTSGIDEALTVLKQLDSLLVFDSNQYMGLHGIDLHAKAKDKFCEAYHIERVKSVIIKKPDGSVSPKLVSIERLLDYQTGARDACGACVYAVDNEHHLHLYPYEAGADFEVIVLCEFTLNKGFEYTDSIPLNDKYVWSIVFPRTVQAILEVQNRYEEAGIWEGKLEDALSKANLRSTRIGGEIPRMYIEGVNPFSRDYPDIR